MSESENRSWSLPNFSLAFQQVASFVAIAKTRNSAEVLDELVQQCFVILPNEPFRSPSDLATAIHALFGIRLAEREVGLSITRLTNRGRLIVIPGEQLALDPGVREALEARIADAKRLEDEVKAAWLAQIVARHPELEVTKLWTALKTFLAGAFRRHGIQAVALLDPQAEIAREHHASLSTIRESAISDLFEEAHRSAARESISSFISAVRSDRKRGEYIAQLADGAFNYFSLTVAPEVSEKLRGQLSKLVLFLDTNFLFGILQLHANPQVDVSAELLDVIQKFKLPFMLRYHEATTREMYNTLYYFGGELRKRKWPQSISRAAVQSGALSGIELRYHQKHSERSIEVDDFLSPYDHWDILLKDRGIDIYRVESSDQRLRARADLEAAYKAFLGRLRREKPYDAIQHDMSVLETVRSLRSNAKSTLDAGAILVTCDYYLCRFDWESSRDDGKPNCAVLPSLLWQILRPFVSNSQGFDQAFAETFALPEFMLTRGGAERAASRMLSILAGYQDIPEETAAKMLANDLLLAELQTKKTDKEFAEAVESALANENAVLLEEKAALEGQLSVEKEQREARGRELNTTAQILREKERAQAQQEKVLQEKENALRSLGRQNVKQNQEVRETVQQVLDEQRKNQEAEARSQAAERSALRTSKKASIIIGVLLVLVFEITVNSVLRWEWLLSHPNSFGLQGCISLMTFFVILGTWVKPWRKVLWVVGVFGALLVALQIVGGPAKAP